MPQIGYGEPPKWCPIVAIAALDEQWAPYRCLVTTFKERTMDLLAATYDTTAGPEPLSDYLRAIRQVPPLAAAEELALAQRLGAGGPPGGPPRGGAPPPPRGRGGGAPPQPGGPPAEPCPG